MVPGRRILFVDSQTLFREAVTALCRERPGVDEAVAAGTVREAVDVLKANDFDVVFTAPRMPDGTPFDIPRRIRAARESARILILDEEFSLLHVRAAVQLQVYGYWTKRAEFEHLMTAVERVMDGRYAYCPCTNAVVRMTPRGPMFIVPPDRDLLGRLTHRELEVLFHLARGKTLRECAEELQLSTSTVDNHKTHMMRKLGVKRTVELISVAYRNGLLD
ncbi:MAG: DNA-binding response regulator [Planctomycetota bacterium]|nr:MAG: DNA-binding response regulator [Planctomycetota bacterium]